MGRLKMFTPERLGLLALAAGLIAFAIMGMARGCSSAGAPREQEHSAAAMAESIAAAADSLAVQEKGVGSGKKAKKKKEPKKSARAPYKRSPLDESAE